MSYFDKQVILMFLGVPGSGKSYFARQAAERMGAIKLNGDSMRLAIFGSLENIQKAYDSRERHIVNTYVFNAIDYAADQILLRGGDVVYDAHHNKRTDREELEKLATKHDALALLIWIKTPEDLALKRAQSRDANIDQRKFSEEQAKESITRHKANMNEPDEKEKLIIIGGEDTFEKQFAEFERRAKEIAGASGQTS